MFERAIGYKEISSFPFCKYNGGGLTMRVMVGRVGGLAEGVGVCRYGHVFPWKQSFNYFVFLILFIVVCSKAWVHNNKTNILNKHPVKTYINK